VGGKTVLGGKRKTARLPKTIPEKIDTVTEARKKEIKQDAETCFGENSRGCRTSRGLGKPVELATQTKNKNPRREQLGKGKRDQLPTQGRTIAGQAKPKKKCILPKFPLREGPPPRGK